MSKSKEKLQKLEKKIEKEKQEKMAKMQLEAAREIAMTGFSRYGIRDFFENPTVQTLLLSLAVFFGLFFGLGILFFYTRNFQWFTELLAIFTGTLIPGIPNYIWFIGIVALVIALVIITIRRKKPEK